MTDPLLTLTDRAASALQAAGVGEVIVDEDGLRAYRDPFPIAAPDRFRPAAAVKVTDITQVQAVLRLANEHRFAVWPISQGKNLGYGGPAPALSGTVVLDLSGMNRVLEVNDELAYAVVEPGVRFFDLADHLRAGGHALWPSVPGLGWGSVLGNALDRGVGGTGAYGNHADAACGIEVVLANGDVVRSGMGAMTSSTSWHLYKHGFGPSVDGLFSQSNLGVVTKMGVWLMPQPECFAICGIELEEEDQLEGFIDAIRPLLVRGLIDGKALLRNPVAVAAAAAPRSRWYAGDDAMPEEAIAAMAADLGVGWWSGRFALYGDEDVVRARLSVIERTLATVPGLSLSPRFYAGDTHPDDLAPGDGGMAGVPSMGSWQKTQWRGGDGGHLDFSPIAPLTGRDAAVQSRLVRRRAREFGFDPYCTLGANTRYMNHIMMILFDSADPDEVARARELFTVLVRDAAQLGYAEYRSHLSFMDLVAAQNDFNDHALLRLQETIKDAVDPAGILAPGKQGVWPAALRKSGNSAS